MTYTMDQVIAHTRNLTRNLSNSRTMAGLLETIGHAQGHAMISTGVTVRCPDVVICWDDNEGWRMFNVDYREPKTGGLMAWSPPDPKLLPFVVVSPDGSWKPDEAYQELPA